MKNNGNKNQDKGQSHAVHAISSSKKGLLLSLILTGAFFIVELVVGFNINSVAVIADAAHNFSAAAGLGIALIAVILTSKPPSKIRTYGFFKAEILAAWINGFLLLGMAYMIAKKGIYNLLNPSDVATLPMLILAMIGLVIGGIPAVILYKKQKTDINTKGAFWHVMETVFGSAAVLVAALIIRFTGWIQADALMGMLLAPVLVIASWNIIKESTKALIDLTPKDINVAEIKKSIKKVKGVINIHHMHAWAITSGKNIFSAHVQVRKSSDSQVILEKIRKILKEKLNFYFSTIQVEKKCTDVKEAREIDISEGI